MSSSFDKLVQSPFKFRLFLLMKLPSAYFSGVRVREFSSSKAVVSVPFNWFSQNPFRSTYFACLAMAAEMSTGILALSNIYGASKSVSMLVTKLEAEYYKKADTITFFTCEDGDAIRNCIQQAIDTGEATQIRAKAIGKNNEGELIAEFNITWSFRLRK